MGNPTTVPVDVQDDRTLAGKGTEMDDGAWVLLPERELKSPGIGGARGHEPLRLGRELGILWRVEDQPRKPPLHV